MTVNIILVFSAVALLVYLLLRLREQRSLTKDEPLEDVAPVDIEAFRNLVDPEEDQFLRENLSSADFRAVQRERLAAAVVYVHATWRNAGVMMRMGEATRYASDPDVATAAQQLIDSAVRLRMYCPLAIVKLRAAALLPGTNLSFGTMLDHYEQLRSMAHQLGRLQDPSRPAHLLSL